MSSSFWRFLFALEAPQSFADDKRWRLSAFFRYNRTKPEHWELWMITDRPPRGKLLLEEFGKSERLTKLVLPEDGRLAASAKSIEEAMSSEKRVAVGRACEEFLAAAADFYGVRKPAVRVLASRPLRVYESGWSTELFGDYDPEQNLTRVWMRTAVRKRMTSFGTFISTLCHEFCHQLDFQLLGFRDSPHTRGFYERAALLYHHARGTPRKPLVWIRLSDGRFRIDWARMRKGI
jgi:hypothetical protein